jgi:uncharacterized membrane-anchored protein YjiN (DUF445 family)
VDLRGAVKKFLLALVLAVFIISIFCYGAAGVYFFADGLRAQSGGGILLGLACWGGVALFSLPLWLLYALHLQRNMLQQQKAQDTLENLRDDSSFREISRASREANSHE